MEMLTVHRPTEADREFFQWDVGGELPVVPGIGPWHERTTMVIVRDLDVSEDDLIATCRSTFEASGHGDETFGEPLESIFREIASDAMEAAAEHPIGTLLRLVQGCNDDGLWQYLLEPAESDKR
ncbi:hypothetical protein A5624_08535 [Mycobacterium sp. 1482292.6]|uniref:hypothetical protein n=1 Tax=Mycobacterium TaxID=1763 RepID=UPI0007EF06F0|nr:MULTISPECIES: hypothetical protein [Mycobacterium]OBJ00224.1 hypothetical protein A5624_08535 [Mycobacterium sp. 1482292.6]OBK65862.1 hypothetical protein A5653_02840 [Mycobacterium colombiense]